MKLPNNIDSGWSTIKADPYLKPEKINIRAEHPTMPRQTLYTNLGGAEFKAPKLIN